MEPIHLLLVDDEQVIRAVIARELSLNNYLVQTAASGEEALRLLQSCRFDAVITDLNMPDIDGISVLRASKKMAPLTCVIILTGYADMSSAIEALRLGADDYLTKPCDLDELLHRLKYCLEKKSLLDQLTQQNILLEKEIEIRRQYEQKLQEARITLEQRVKERTIELEEINIALNVLLAKRQRDRQTLERQILANVAELVEPYLQKLSDSRLSSEQETYVSIIASNISELTSSLTQNVAAQFSRLTPAEIQVANLVKLGKRTKEIAQVMCLSPGTINVHRKNIRKKLGLTNQKANLQTVLSSYSQPA